jgi:hypothetical protein
MAKRRDTERGLPGRLRGRHTGDGEDAWALLETTFRPKKGAKDAPFPERLKSFLAAEKY